MHDLEVEVGEVAGGGPVADASRVHRHAGERDRLVDRHGLDPEIEAALQQRIGLLLVGEGEALVNPVHEVERVELDAGDRPPLLDLALEVLHGLRALSRAYRAVAEHSPGARRRISSPTLIGELSCQTPQAGIE